KFSRGKFARFISSKGFYGALAVCLVGAGIATYMAVDRTINVLEQTTAGVGENLLPALPEAAEVAGGAHGVPLERPPTPQPEQSAQEPSSSVSASYSEEPSAQPAPSEQPAQPAVSPRLSYVLPVVGDIVKPFSDGELVRNVTMGDWRTHDGIDIQAEAGTQIYAAADGVVLEVRTDPLWGTVVVIEHADGYQTHYSGLAANVPVRPGEQVTGRQAIGQLEGVPSENQSGRVHLHFAVLRDGAWINPIDLIN
ncbi:MAG: peptidoglycan DD-metalloendopeptidase family protein, partial [Oscillospiraceae bacterium]|nr:peptidoglycan DD-metalloendopeptidase family protein [Oscillospiraceae bacterium]